MIYVSSSCIKAQYIKQSEKHLQRVDLAVLSFLVVVSIIRKF